MLSYATPLHFLFPELVLKAVSNFCESKICCQINFFSLLQSTINAKVNVLGNNGKWQNDLISIFEGDRNWNIKHL